MQADPSGYHPATPDSYLAPSLDCATSTIDDLTLALTNFSRVPSPEPQRLVCCCGDEDCEATKGWLALKLKLESRLILSAEVGSALLQRHEAYVRRHEVCSATSSPSTQPSSSTLRKATQDSVSVIDQDARVVELLNENAIQEKRLTQALVNNEISEVSNKALLLELEEARSAVSKLSAHYARTLGLDNKLSVVLQENDDIRQERDSQTHRASTAEARLNALKDRTDKLQAEVERLQYDLEVRRLQRFESSESLLQDVRSRLKGLRVSPISKCASEEDSEVTKVIEYLVMDNEALRADNKELHKLLTDSREDLQTLQREIGEQSIVPPIQVDTPSKHSRTSNEPSLLSSARRPISVELGSRPTYEPLTPETGCRPISPADSLLASTSKHTNFAHPQPQHPPSRSILDAELEYDQGTLNPNQTTKAIQTDRLLASPVLNHITSFIDQSSMSPHDGHSDSSSLFDSVGSPMSSLLERMHSLLHRMTQADALTLTNRLKRQHLRGADVRHLSRTTVSNILSDVSRLRVQYRTWLEDDKLTTLCTRKDLRGLFKLFKEFLEELGQIRVTLNDVILEPSIAVKISEAALDPMKVEAMEERKATGISIGAGWMAPFSKLLNSSLHDMNILPSTTRTSPRPTSGGHGNIRASRSVPKLGPALAASATTVNVEFSGAGTGKSVTSIFSAHPNNESTNGRIPSLPQPPASTQASVRSVMDIFAGALHPDDVSDPWVVLPRTPQRSQTALSMAEPVEPGTTTIGRSVARRRKTSLSQNVDAILDAPTTLICSIEDPEVRDIPGPLMERTLRRRGLSDSSIRSTFMNQGGVGNITRSTEPGEPLVERISVLRTISRTVHNFKQVASHTISGAILPIPTPLQPPTVNSALEQHNSYPSACSNNPNTTHSRPSRRSSATLNSLVPNLPSWTVGVALDSTPSRNTHNGFREDTSVPRLFGREGGREV